MSKNLDFYSHSKLSYKKFVQKKISESKNDSSKLLRMSGYKMTQNFVNRITNGIQAGSYLWQHDVRNNPF